MTIAAGLLPELDNEMRTTRALLERVPDAKADWKPHAKSMSMGQLGAHIAALVSWVAPTVTDTQLDVIGPEAKKYSLQWESSAATLAAFDRLVAESRAMIAASGDAALMVPWTLRAGDHVILVLPRVAVLRTMVLNHIIHHRGQLSVYLRLNDVAVPEMYGPTADSVR